MQTELMDPSLLDLDQRPNLDILTALQVSQLRAVNCVANVHPVIDQAVSAAANRLLSTKGRLILAGAGASGRIAVQDGAEMWPTYGWPHSRLILSMAGGEKALLQSVEGVEDDADDAKAQAEQAQVGTDDVVLALAASGRSRWTCSWLKAARDAGALTIGMANNVNTPLLELAEYPVFLDSGAEVLGGSTRMAAGTAQKIALNLFSTNLMIRLNRTYGNLMVDMVAVNNKLDERRIRLLQGVLPELDDAAAATAIKAANGWVKLAALMAKGQDANSGKRLLEQHQGSLRESLASLE